MKRVPIVTLSGKATHLYFQDLGFSLPSKEGHEVCSAWFYCEGAFVISQIDNDLFALVADKDEFRSRGDMEMVQSLCERADLDFASLDLTRVEDWPPATVDDFDEDDSE